MIAKVLKTVGMYGCNPNLTHSARASLGPDDDGESMKESWEYASIIGMLMYPANNTKPDISHSVHIRARYTHPLKRSHTTTVKLILRHLKGT